jgi:Flp pilus assembly protein TadD
MPDAGQESHFVLLARANSLFEAGQVGESEQICRLILQQNPRVAEAWNLLAMISLAAKNFHAAMEQFRHAIAIDPDAAVLRSNLGRIYLSNGEFDAAADELGNAVRLDPNQPMNHYWFGLALHELRRDQEAVATFDAAIKLAPKFASAHIGRASSLQRLGRLDECEQAIRTALQLNAQEPAAFDLLGVLMVSRASPREAIAAFRKSITLKPDNPMVHWNLAMSLLLIGEMEEGWEEAEWRLKVPSLGLAREFPQPQWDGSDPSGKTILLHVEGGHGDGIQFIRYANQITGRGARLILECQPALMRLFQCVEGIDAIIPRGHALPVFDLHIPLVGLPRIFKATLSTIPARVPYLAPPRREIERWKDKLCAERKFRVGLVWSGRRSVAGDNRTSSADVFAPLADIEPVKFFSLQKGPVSSQRPSERMDLADFTAEISDFADLAALIENLDLVISVDTSVAHLAGALAKPVWVLIPFQPDFRWLEERTDSPWYPTMRLFRQKSPGDWDSVIREIAQALRHAPALNATKSQS